MLLALTSAVPAATLADITAAAERGDAAAQYELALRHFNGQGIPRDFGAAAQWFVKAAEQGHGAALHQLGFMYEFGMGVAKDDLQAFQFYSMAITAGERGELTVQGRDRVRGRLQPAQAEEAERRVKSWQPRRP